MIRRPPRTALVPYTTLFRSFIQAMFLVVINGRRASSEPTTVISANAVDMDQRSSRDVLRQWNSSVPARRIQCVALPRSEEHTSELQSRQYLVCRLLLEKKKN